MNLTFLALGVLLGGLGIIYFISGRFTKKNEDYVEKFPEREIDENTEKEPFREEPIEIEKQIVLEGTIKESKRGETKSPKVSKKKSSSLSSIGVDELPKVKKSSYKKSYNKKRKDTKKDKGDDLLLS